MNLSAVRCSAILLLMISHLTNATDCKVEGCHIKGTSTIAACSAVSSAWAAQIAATATPTVSAKLAYDCVTSVPLDKAAALKFVDELRPYLEWQSSLAFLKNPPADYPFPPHDVLGALDNLRARLEADHYSNEFTWHQDMYLNVFNPAYDSHLHVFSDILTNAIEWARPIALVSISKDGNSAPVVKAYDDVMSSPENAPVLSLINGVDAATFILEQALRATSNSDTDSAYNSMFYHKASGAYDGTGYFKQGGRTRYVYPGETTSFTFVNGTTIELPNNFAPGAAVNKVPAPSTTSATPSSTTTTVPLPDSTGVDGYPKPVVIGSDSSVSGYFIDEQGFNDVAVLAIRSFAPRSLVRFQEAVGEFFVAAARSGKTKLVVDIQVNAGGYIMQGYDTYRQIFPDIVQKGSGRFRYSSSFKALSEIFSKNCEGYDPITASETLITQCENFHYWRHDVDVNHNHFTSYKAKFPPLIYNDDEYTELIEWDYENPLISSNATHGYGFEITGYGLRKNFTRPFGGPENIVLLYDGACSSTCALFSKFMRWDAGVKSIAMGGRPGVKGKIQGVGGTKGSQNYYLSDVAAIAEFDRFTPYVDSRVSSAGINIRDEILSQNWGDGVPRQFVPENSDCRLYWQAEMLTDITTVWKAAASAAFKGGKCAFGHIDNKAVPPAEKRTDNHATLFCRKHFSSPKDSIQKFASIEKRDEQMEKSWIFKANQYVVSEE
ncbi:peptidase s41 family protein [Colletotrichum truncatum]|uniref:Peptidase s41 family protein n=1 Tax=Colletotrichum truncatum TaxID=5467 RepID=A0ACC3YLZ6_COLTU|nr:peptidase s41 family protein [Colletotrichum truncatum]KAF6797463.1 peptidase s41 family protein [Colletotrichum truncatum]